MDRKNKISLIIPCYNEEEALPVFYSELMKGLGAGGRLWELIERKPQLPFNGGSLFRYCS